MSKKILLIQYKERSEHFKEHCLPDSLITSIVPSPSWEANSSSTSQEIPRILWNPSAHYRIHNSQSLGPSLSHTNPVHANPNGDCEIHINIILPSMPRSSKCSLFFRSPHQNPACISPLPPYVPHVPPISFESCVHNLFIGYLTTVDLGGLVVSVLATGPKVRGFDPDRGRWWGW
jgi:hypothetical protein